MKYGDMVTIVSLSYKKYDQIYETILSVLNQDYPRIELIISDDGFTEFPEKDIENFIENYRRDNLSEFVVRKNSKNIGTVKHENVVCAMANGEYIIELSCGDVFYSNESVSKIVKRIEKTNPDIITYRRLVCDLNGNPMCYYPHTRDISKIMNMDYKEQYEAIISGYFYDMVSGSAVAYKTSFIQKEQFDEKYRLMEDCPLFTKYLFFNKIDCAYDIVGIKYALGGVSNTNNPLIIEDMRTYNNTDRIKHLNEISYFTREIVRYQLARANGESRVLIAFRFPLVIIWLVKYKINQMIGVYQDKKELH